MSMNVGVRIFNKTFFFNVLVFTVFFLIHLVLSFSSNTPLFYPDEFGYIGNARLIIFDQMEVTKYFPGYSLLLIPALLISNDIEIAYKLIQIINSLVMAFIPIMSMKLLRIFDENISPKKIYIIAISSGLYPAFLLYSNFAMTETVIIPSATLLVLIFAKLLENFRSVFLWSCLLIIVAYMILVHPRNVVIVPAIIITLVIHYLTTNFKELSKKNKLIHLMGLIIVFLIICSLIAYFAINLGYASRLQMLLGEIADSKFILTITGQVLYLSLSTFGLFLIGIVVAIRSFIREISNKDPKKHGRALIIGFAAINFLFSFLLSTWFMSIPSRADHVIYGRYNESYLLPILLIGFLCIMEIPKVKYLFSTAIIIHCLASFTILSVGREFLESKPLFWNNVFGIHLYKLLFPQFNALYLIIFFTMIIFLLFALRERKGLLILTIAALFITTTTHANYDYFYKGSNYRAKQKTLVDVIALYQEQFSDNGKVRVYFDSEASQWHSLNYIMYLPDLEMIQFSSDSIEDLNSDVANLVMTSRPDFNTLYPGAKLIGIENDFPIYLWVLPGKVQDFYEKIDYVANGNFPTKLPAEAYRSTIKLADHKKVKRKGDFLHIPLEITHAGSGAFWTNLHAMRNSLYSIRIGAAIIDSTGQKLYEERADLPRVLYPGQHIEATLKVNLTDLEIENKCDLILRIGMVHEGVTWFHFMGDQPLEFKLCELLER
jgi:hypothetical protein